MNTVERLLEVIKPFINPKQEKKELAQVFQALRIKVNGEMQALESLLNQSLKMLGEGGRLAIITYHSLEDRMVKNFMKTGNIAGNESKDFFGRNLAPCGFSRRNRLCLRPRKWSPTPAAEAPNCV